MRTMTSEEMRGRILTPLTCRSLVWGDDVSLITLTEVTYGLWHGPLQLPGLVCDVTSVSNRVERVFEQAKSQGSGSLSFRW